jgi:hypothetical protein
MWQSQDAIEIPFIELTDEELEDIDEGCSASSNFL